MTTAGTVREGDERPNSVLGKVSLILSAFGDDDFSLGLAELRDRTGIAKATVHRLCQELVATDFLERDGCNYRLGVRLYAMGLRSPHQRTLRAAARPVIESLAQSLDNAVILAIPHDSELLCVENLGTHRNQARSTADGRRLELHCTAAGKLTLAMLPEQYPLGEVLRSSVRRTAHTLGPAQLPGEICRIREQGYAIEVEEKRLGYLAVAVPVRGRDDTYLGALSVIAPTAGSRITRLLSALTQASTIITTRLARYDSLRVLL
ncbi:IclR family transcriptional regulator [Streptomyces sp. NPDC050548]|uniref:IclR family transcriptional regulator n=1 Tax=Streptomyces sp. NPDC050548 TaxID=3365629 RepID=UPI0037B13148